MKFKESYFHNEYGLSCIEDYIIYILCKDTFKWARIFYKSYFDIEEIINYLLFWGQEYSSINFIERIQDTLVQKGLLKLVCQNLKNMGDVDSKQFFLMELKSGATKELLDIDTWRSDHFVMVCKDAHDKYSYVNDRPYITGSFEFKDLLKYAAKEYVFDIQVINKDIGAVISNKKVVQLEQKLKSETLLGGDLYLGFEKIRDSVGVYRVVARRLQAFFCSYGTSNFIEDEIKRLDNIYLRLEYMNIRKNFNLGKVKALISEAIYVQKNVKRKALERMDIIYDQCR
ncbi:MAG: hypothetical protein NC251_10865 [Lachnoclostridium sp.]|nr:hypothetical protein [Lachnospira sp.]MCM1248921.1 hypothetical protein [Lachnoclostridium sp.]